MQHLACKSAVNSILFPAIRTAKTVETGEIAQAERCFMFPAGKALLSHAPSSAFPLVDIHLLLQPCQSPPCSQEASLACAATSHSSFTSYFQTHVLNDVSLYLINLKAWNYWLEKKNPENVNLAS